MEQFPSGERYTREDLDKAQEELRAATEHFNSFDSGEDMGEEQESEYLARFASAKNEYAEKAKKVKEIEAGLN